MEATEVPQRQQTDGKAGPGWANILLGLFCLFPLGCGPSAAQKQQALKQQQALVQQQQAAQQFLAMQQHTQPPPAPRATPAPPAAATYQAPTPGSHSCPNFRGQFIYPGEDTPVTVQQEACSKLLFHHQDGTTAAVVLDGKPHKLQGEDGQSIVRTSAWEGTTVHIDDKVYKSDGRYIQHGIRLMGVDQQGDILLRTELHAILSGQEFPQGNPTLNVARRIGR